MKWIFCLIIAICYFLPMDLIAQNDTSTAEVGPKQGSLVIVGGGRLSDDIVERFIELAGGKDAPIVFIPTAGGGNDYNESAARLLTSRGASNVMVLHTYNKEVANSNEFIQPLLDAKGIWFAGGRQWRLVDSYADTKSETAFWKVLERGGVIGGTSAGATIQGSYLARGDTKNNQIMMGDHEKGFGFLKNVAIDQHLLARNRHFDLQSILKHRPELLGIGLDENTAIVVKGDQFEVIGSSYVMIYDGHFYSSEGYGSKEIPERHQLFYFLKKGQLYDLNKREVIKN